MKCPHKIFELSTETPLTVLCISSMRWLHPASAQLCCIYNLSIVAATYSNEAMLHQQNRFITLDIIINIIVLSQYLSLSLSLQGVGQGTEWLHKSGHHGRDLQNIQGTMIWHNFQKNIGQNNLQVDLKVDDLKSKLDRNGNIRKNEFIEFSIESKLLDVTERKTSSVDTPKVGIRNNCSSINKLLLLEH